VLRLREPVVLVCFLAQPVSFGAIDGQPVRVLFPLLSPTVQSHLQLLAQLSYALHDRSLRGLIDRQAPAGAILERLRALESKMQNAGPLPAAPQ
jgi:PTS system nitrogen regulatory IIA component